jgi:hypothetical protein
MTIATNRENLDNGSPDGCRVRGLARQVIDGATTRTLLKSESGALCLFNVTAGQVFTLPVCHADDIGMYFDFAVTVIGIGSYSIDTGDAANFIGGGIAGTSTTAGGTDAFPATIASTVSIDLDSTETGEDPGGLFTLTCISATEWACGGYTCGSGTLATPFA